MTTRTLLLAALLASSLLPAGPGDAATSAGEGSAWVPGEVLVRFRPSLGAQRIQASLAAQGHALLDAVGDTGWVRVRPASGQSVLEAVAAYAADPAVEFAQPNFRYHTTAVPNDPGYGQVWGLKNTGQTITNAFTQPPGTAIGYGTANPGTPGDDMNLEAAWNQLTDCSGVVVAVVDTGVNYNQEDLAANMWTSAAYPKHGYDFVGGTNDPMDTNGHGTHVAGTIGAVGNNGKGITGVCWTARIMAVRVMNTVGSGTTADVIAGIHFAVVNGARVINMSLGGSGGFDQAFSDAISEARSGDVSVVVAAGNEASNNDQVANWPCNFTQANLLCVAALDQAYGLASFSNFGATTVGVGAPGTNVVSTWNGTLSEVAASMTSGWNFSPSPGWGYNSLGSAPRISNPPNLTASSGSYAPGIDQRAYTDVVSTGGDVVVLKYSAFINIPANDFLVTAFRAGTPQGDPFAAGGTEVGRVTNTNTTPYLYGQTFDVTPCRGTTCSVGVRLQSGSTAGGQGVALQRVRLSQTSLDATSYNTINGTSMATPMAAGVVVLVRAFNPQYTAVDAVKAVASGGRSVAALSGTTKSGNAVDAMRALAYIQPPTGLAAAVQ